LTALAVVELVVLVSCLLELSAECSNLAAAPALGESNFFALRVSVAESAGVFVSHRFSLRWGSRVVPL
jgi:hypothetical protein